MKSSYPLGVGDWLSFGGSFLLVLCIMVALYYALKKVGNIGLHRRHLRQLHLLETHTLGNRQRIVLVRAKDREILLGITAQQIAPLAEWPAEEEPVDESSDTRSPSTDVEVTSGAGLKRMLASFQRNKTGTP